MTRIVQSFWSGGNPHPVEGTYGWQRPEHNLMSWALSSNLIRRYYDDLVLYTDKAGEDLLIRKLRLPYTEVHVELDIFNSFPAGAWPLSKIYVYSKQREPFIYLDGDVFIWKRFDPRIEQASLAVQNIELIPKESYEAFVSSLEFIPEPLRNCRARSGKFEMVNTGVFGGCDYDLLQEYYRVTYEATLNNPATVSGSSMSFGLFIEQFLLTQLIRRRNVGVERVFPQVFDNPHYAGFADFEDVPSKRTYLHLLGMYKTNPRALRLLNNQLRQDFPSVYERVMPSTKLTAFDENILQRDLECHRYYQFLNEDGKSRVLISIDPAVKLCGSDRDGFIASIPDFNRQFIEVALDELDIELFRCLSEEKTLKQVLEDMSAHFDDDIGPEYEELIFGRIKSFVFNRMVVMRTLKSNLWKRKQLSM